MMRRASSASSGCTDSRTSPSPSTDSGKIECGTSELTTDITPCASSRLRTTRASIADELRKMTARSGNGRRHFVHLEQNHGHVVVLWRVADKRRDFAQHALTQLVGREIGVVLGELAETGLAKAVVVRVHRLADAVSEEQVQIAGVQRNGVLLEQPPRHPPVVDLQAQP